MKNKEEKSAAAGFDALQLARPAVQRASAYHTPREDLNGPTDYTLLDVNESPVSPFRWGREDQLHRYPDSRQRALRSALAKHFSLQPGQVFTGNGSDEVFDLLIRAFAQPHEDALLISPPTFGMYAHYAQLQDVHVTEVPLTPAFDLDKPALEAALQQAGTEGKPKLKLWAVGSPNNPTGNRPNDRLLEALIPRFPGLVIVDEAYGDFSEAASWATRLGEFPNLVVLRTFSKAWGLAGIRVGAALAHPSVVRVLGRVKAPFNLNQLSIAAAIRALQQPATLQHHTRLLVSYRQELARELEKFAFVERVFPSEANFLLVRVTEPKAIFRHLLKAGVLVRDRSGLPGCAGCLRINAGLPEENRQLLDTLATYQPEAGTP